MGGPGGLPALLALGLVTWRLLSATSRRLAGRAGDHCLYKMAQDLGSAFFTQAGISHQAFGREISGELQRLIKVGS